MSTALIARRPGREHSAKTVATAERLHAAGWSYPRIQQLIERELGVQVHVNTLRIWTNPKARARHHRTDSRLKAQRRAERATGRLAGNVRRPEMMWTRMLALDRAGLSPAAVAKVMNLDFDLGLTLHQVHYAFAVGQPPRCLGGAA